ncbi:hypothetical protein [Actinomadura rupiterrae]|uniref:hypothetical protein n=1 Tax=Actinomadura rupiterrae TaxID=559627 RepID=UPI0020A3980B|nr:hypothetical protein [Actinomadura rupiterrae]MCP2335384.1 preprotein translocase subunit SecY [Actinomadura rupiterrae]
MYRKVLVTLIAVLIFRIGQNAPLPGVQPSDARHAANTWADHGDMHALLDVLTGGALLRLTVFGLGAWPAAAGFVGIGLLSLGVPRLEALRRQGPAGHRLLARHARTLALLLGAVASCITVAIAGHLRDRSALTLVTLACCLTAGTAATLLLIEWITDRGLGDGFSVLLLTQLLAALPRHLHGTRGATAAACALLALAVLVQLRRTARMIPVQYRRTASIRQPKTTYMPVRVMPYTLIPMLGAGLILLALRAWTPLGTPWTLAAAAATALLLDLIAAPTAINPRRIAAELTRTAAFVPGIRPGRPTSEFFDYINARVTQVGVLAAPALTVLTLAATPPLALPLLITLIASLRTFEQQNLEARTVPHLHRPLPDP